MHHTEPCELTDTESIIEAVGGAPHTQLFFMIDERQNQISWQTVQWLLRHVTKTIIADLTGALKEKSGDHQIQWDSSGDHECECDISEFSLNNTAFHFFIHAC